MQLVMVHDLSSPSFGTPFDELYAAGAAAIYPPGTVIAEAAVELLDTLG